MKTTEQHSNVVVRYVFLTIGAISFALGNLGYRITTIANSSFLYANVILFGSWI